MVRLVGLVGPVRLAGPETTSKLTSNPLEAVAVRVGTFVQKVSLMAGKVMVWSALVMSAARDG